MPNPPSTRLAYIVLRVQIDERVSNNVAHDLALRSVDRCIEDVNREFHIELESMTVLDDLKDFSATHVSREAVTASGDNASSGLSQMPWRSPVSQEISATRVTGTKSNTPDLLAELSPNESQKEESPQTSRRIDERVGCDTAPVEAHTSRQLSCGYDCGHTEEQHQAFDSGVLAGEQGKDEDDCPYQDDELSEDWLCGYSVGHLNGRQVA